MNRKNLTAAVLAGLAGAAGLAGSAQAVNLNPDGLGQVLVYPYYTTNGGNQTILSVVNTTDQAKAVKVRFLEGYNSREVLDFNLYMSKYDVWVAAVADDGAGTPTLYVPDTSCTVPYLYGDGGVQPFLPYAYTGDYEDGGPTDISRAAEGHFEMIEMGTLTNESARAATKDLPARVGSATAATHVLDDGEEVPYDCDQLVRNWTGYGSGGKPDPLDGMWYDQAVSGECGDGDQACIDTIRNSGGLFGGASVVNSTNGTMYSYDAKAIQGFDSSQDGIHYVPGTVRPGLNDGNENTAYVFFGTPQNQAVALYYGEGVGAVSAVFMHDTMMNTFTIEEDISASTEWVLTFPTKSFYVDVLEDRVIYYPDPSDPGCNGWDPGEPFPTWTGDHNTMPTGWQQCTYIKTTVIGGDAKPPFTEAFDGESCEYASFRIWDREESPKLTPTSPDDPPIVSPAPPGPGGGGSSAPFELCYETNVMRFGDGVIFDSDPDTVLTVSNTPDAGWGRIDFQWDSGDTKTREQRLDENGLVGLPVTGFAAEEYENNFAEGADVKAYYGGLYQHKGSVRRVSVAD